jgi:hypothetical protein
MKKYLYIILFPALLSCNEWLTVTPKSEISEEHLFSTEAGYRSALYGLYVQLGQTSLYGRNLTMGFLDVLAQYYEIPSNTYSYYEVANYDYENTLTRQYIDDIWSSGYNFIANANNLLEHLPGRETGFFTDERAYRVLKGEALGLRALLHFDLLRLFAPSFTVAPNAKAIPYVTSLSKTPFPQLTVRQVIDKCLEDLQAASGLLYEVDPISPYFETFTEGGTTNASREDYMHDGGFLFVRRERMNYLAVRALMARVHLYAGNTEEAQALSVECISSARAAVTTNLLTLFVEKLPEISNSLFSTEAAVNQRLVVPKERKEAIYETAIYGSVDTRTATYFQYYTGTSEEFLAKFRITRSTVPPTYATVPVITGAEIHLIYSETAETEEDQFARLNAVRNAYGLTPSYDLDALINNYEEELFKEYRKRFVGEGLLFYFMKRKNYRQIPYAGSGVSVDQVYSLLDYLPTAEYDYGLINK